MAQDNAVVEDTTQGEGSASPEQGGGEGKQEQPGQPAEKSAEKAIQERLASLEREAKEAREEARFWSERAKGSAQPEKPPEKEKDDDFSDLLGEIADGGDTDSFIDDLTSGGASALEKRGFLTKKQAIKLMQQVAERTADKIASKKVEGAKKGLERDAEIMRKFPDLQDADSALFKATQERFRKMVERNPARRNDPDALLEAAEYAQLTIPKQDPKRNARVAGQGQNGSGGGFEAGESEGLTAAQRAIIKNFGLTEEQYVARASKGVQIKGMPRV